MTKQTMTMEPVFDGGTRTKVQDGIFMNHDGRFVIMRFQSGEGWIEIRSASEAEIRTFDQLRQAFSGQRISAEVAQ